jgi:GT2 family glycosyltransferase/glycosyltransferase involved in cell wall biosynthesis
MLEIYRNQKEWKNKSKEGRKKVLARYTWDKIIPEYEKEFIALALENRGRWKIRLIGSLRDQRVRLDEQERRLADHIGERGVLRKMIEDQTAVIQNQAELIRDQRIRLEEQGRNYAQEVAKRDEQIHALSSQLNEAISEENELGSRLNETLKERDTVWNQLNQIYLSNFWKVASWYYKIRNKSLLIRSIYVAVKWLKKNIKRKPVVENGSKFTSPEPKVDRLTAEVTLQPAPKIHRSKKTPQYEVICLPIIDWFFRFQRPQQILSQFAKNGSRVFYINPKFLGESEGYFQAKEIRENIFDISIAADTSLNIYTGRIDEKNLDMMIKSFENLRREMGIVEAICIVQLPFWQPLAKKVKEDFGWKIIYDCMDEHSGFSTNEESMLSHEELLARECNLLVTTASPLYEKMRTYNERCILLPNAADFNHFSYLPPNEILREIEKPIIGYYGAISDWFDEELVEYLAKNKEDWNFVFIGHTFGSNISKLQQMANVHFLGEEPYSELPKYLYWFDVCIIPFKLNNLIRATSPVKFYEFMSSGKKVVSVEIPELLPFSKYLYLAKDKNDFLKKIEMALQENDQNIVSERIELAKKNTWEERYHILSSEIKNIYPEASIIIVTYNNLNYTKLCIESLFSKTQYPNFEIIIVDNNSTDGTKDYLRDLADKKNEVKVIFNSDNKGFPKGNNQGILAASGEYIVFLNNDTVVTRGWLSKLIKHLENKDIGIVGPVTNFCGNEAKIDVPYKNIEEMDGFSEGYLRKNMEPVEFDIKVLAMYCLVMKKRLIEEVGLLDERFEIGMFEDDDFSHRVRLKGYRVVCVEDVFIHHFGEVSFNKLKESGEYMKLFDRNKKRFEKKWGIKWEPHKYRETKN